MSRVSEQYALRQREVIALGIIAQRNVISSLELRELLDSRNDEVLASWLSGLMKNRIVLTRGKTKGTEYFVNPELLRQLEFRGQTDLSRIEGHRLKNLIIEDLEIYSPSSIHDIHVRIGEGINRKKISRQLEGLIQDGVVRKEGKGRWTTYALSSAKEAE